VRPALKWRARDRILNDMFHILVQCQRAKGAAEVGTPLRRDVASLIPVCRVQARRAQGQCNMIRLLFFFFYFFSGGQRPP
jgi:hypothetical protein